ncbi:unnamed protein product [Arctogadus glacialis]
MISWHKDLHQAHPGRGGGGEEEEEEVWENSEILDEEGTAGSIITCSIWTKGHLLLFSPD